VWAQPPLHGHPEWSTATAAPWLGVDLCQLGVPDLGKIYVEVQGQELFLPGRVGRAVPSREEQILATWTWSVVCYRPLGTQVGSELFSCWCEPSCLRWSGQHLSLHSSKASRRLLRLGTQICVCGHRIMEWFGLEGASKTIWFQPPCHRQGHLPPDQSAEGPIQPGLEHCQGGGSHSFSGQPGPGPHHPHCIEFLPNT